MCVVVVWSEMFYKLVLMKHNVNLPLVKLRQQLVLSQIIFQQVAMASVDLQVVSLIAARKSP